ncbi:phospho-N-acetylmuramoyl-pentapeptide-transferase [Deinococcus radiophilus]|uniref:Phospho-N-acetylmuramoyl-pentapeptide-transferase n=1 Tax=Deinococcus radiophilus TaxID=32062 RepID=A0A3S0KHM5_9DEIO|nr:phospho-N-acetylmuramoyl-pentapeptide-transferase [Deinococcus radiophilus]RTR30723.1 phospho-N-acetylmuramoyl-pentapeptide-transferase [Deinococcus radiophilus]UFA51276.1 phospho-N-acetylmuramoyl-pentapeptide-transferase [Deinococcus radiophilus]
MLIAAILSWFLTGLFINQSKKRGWGQPVRSDGPQSHLAKEGTPTAGGVAFTLVTLLIWLVLFATGQGGGMREVLLVVIAALMGVVGGLDDWFKVQSRMKGSGKKELLAREKFPLQILFSLIFAYLAVPYASHELVPSLGYWGDMLLYTFVMVGSVNAFNFTDGNDGLLAGVAMIVLLPLLALSPVAALLVASLLGFLWFNANPAKVFMGDMGSHAIGAIAAGAYILYADVWLLPIAAIIPVAAVLSVMIQVFFFKTQGRRIFKMTPIHHHFELSGWPEVLVTQRFWVITALATALAWYLLGGRP